jgi:pterin-4a-carbinolamine dehydratase
MTTQTAKHTTGTFPPFYLADWERKVSDTDYRLIRTFELINDLDARRFAAQVVKIGNTLQQIPTVYIYKRWVCVVCRVIRPDGLHVDDVILPGSIDEAYANWHVSAAA